MKKTLEIAENYLNQGYSVIPLKPRSKIPLLSKWKPYQEKLPTKDELKKWFKNTDNNIGVVTGNVSGLVVVDIDDKKMNLAKFDLPPTSIIETANGFHFYYQLPEGVKVKNEVRIDDKKMDIRGEGGYVVGVGSTHESGFEYKYAISHLYFKLGNPVKCPDWLIERGQTKKHTKKDWMPILKEGISEGERNDKLTSLVGLLLSKHSKEVAYEILSAFNESKCQPPLSNRELEAIFNSINNRESSKEINEVKQFTPFSYKTLLKKEFSPVEWVVEGLIPAEGTTVISGEAATFKTWLLVELGIKVAMGEKFLDQFNTSQMNVLFIDEDNGERLLKQRLELLGREENPPFYFLSRNGFQLKEKDVDLVLNIAKEKDIKLIFIDALRNVHDEDENSSTAMSPIMNQLKEFNKKGIAVVFVHHNRKANLFNKNITQEIRGTTAIRAFVECHIAINLIKDETIKIEQTKIRSSQAIIPFKIEAITDKNGFHFDYLGEMKERKTKGSEINSLIKLVLRDEVLNSTKLLKAIRGISKEEIADRTYRDTKSRMIEKNELFGKKRGREQLLSISEFK